MRRADRRYTKGEVMSVMEPMIDRWFNSRFDDLTDPQAMAIPLIHQRRNVLVSSPTGSGKTLTAFLSIINELTRYHREGTLEERIYCIYVSPLKALANDVNHNLNEPLGEMTALEESIGMDFPAIRVAVRSGDTSQYERQKMLRKPPHILITTPESLALILAAPKFKERLQQVEWVILDEIHDICDSKRGVFLSLTLERLRAHCGRPFTRIGLSATMAPMEAIAQYLAGYEDGRPRDVTLVEVGGQRDLDLSVICPTDDMTALSFEIVNSKMYDMLKEMIDQHDTTLVFTNTRSGTESVVYKLRERGLEDVEAHHGSLSKETRLDVEGRLKRGELRCVVSSTSLELGIDIGSVDLVCQIGSPKSVAKGLQRIGRSGHGLGLTSKGRMIVFDTDDLVECAVLNRAAHRAEIDRVSIPEDSLDVLAQSIVGMSIEQRWDIDDALRVIRGSYCYRDLTEGSLMSVIRYLASRDEFEGVYSKIWYDEEERLFGRRKGSRMIYFLNLGTIPEEANYRVFTQRGGMVGDLSEKFVERLTQGDIFVLGGRSYQFVRAKGMKAFVKEAQGRKPTVPSWSGEMLPRSFDLSMQIARFRGEMAARLDDDDADVVEWLMRDFDIDDGSARTILSYFREQRTVGGMVPNDRTLAVERYVDVSGNENMVFHFPFGRRVNDALSRAYAARISSRHSCNVSVSIGDDSFMLNIPRRVEISEIPGMLRPDELEDVLRRAVRDSELFKQRFRHVASRSFMILRNYKGRSVSVNRQQVRSQFLMDELMGMASMPVIEETFQEILTEVMDLENARWVLERITSGEMTVAPIENPTPSPFAHSAILSGISDIVLMEDRSALLRELHRKVLAKAMGDRIREFEFDEDRVVPYFRERVGSIVSEDDVVPLLRRTGPLRAFKERGRSIYPYSDVPRGELNEWIDRMLADGRLATVYLDDAYVIAADDLPMYASALARERELGETDRMVLEALDGHMGVKAIAEAVDVSLDRVSRSLRKLETTYMVGRTRADGGWAYHRRDPPRGRRDAAVSAVVRRHLGCFAPATVDELAFALGLPEGEVQASLDTMVEEGDVAEGRFLVSERMQYMLRRDWLRLRTDAPEVYDENTVESYRRHKSAMRFGSIVECLRHFGALGSPLDVFNRVDGFSLEEWESLRRDGEILWGRFQRGRLRYVHRDDAPMYAALGGRIAPAGVESRVMDVLRATPSSTRELATVLGLPRETVKEAIDRLDRDMRVVRAFQEGEDWSSENVFEPLRARPFDGDPVSALIERVIRVHGPMTVTSVRMATGLDMDLVREAIDDLDVSLVTVGSAQTPMYVMADELPIPRVEEDLEPRVHTLQDPSVQPIWAEVASRYGDRWVHPVLKGGRLIGAAEIWRMSGCVEVRALELTDRRWLGDALDALDGMMRYQRMDGFDLMRVREVADVAVEDLDDATRDEMSSRGYHFVNGFFAKGLFVPETYTAEQLLAQTLVLQRISPDAMYDGPSEAVLSTGSLRSDAEVMLRCRNREPLRKGLERGHLVKVQGVPDYVVHTDRRHAAMFRAARDAEVTDDMAHLISIIRDRQPMEVERLYDVSTLGRSRTQDAIRDLVKGSIVHRDVRRRLRLVPIPEMGVREARLELLRVLFSSYGSFSAEELSRFLKRELPMRELRSLLASLEEDGTLVKGFLREGEDRPVWMLASAPDPRDAAFDTEFVLLPNDSLYHYLQPLIKERFQTPCAVAFDGPRMVGPLRVRLRGDDLRVVEGGTPEVRRVLRRFARRRGLLLTDEESDDEDWDLVEFYEKTHPR